MEHIEKVFGTQCQGTKRASKKHLSNLNIASVAERGYLSVTTNNLHLTVNSSSTVLISGDVSFCISSEGFAFALDGIIDVSWVDEMDANSWREYYNKEIVNGPDLSPGVVVAWFIEGFIDLVGDDILGANFDFTIRYQIDLSKFD